MGDKVLLNSDLPVLSVERYANEDLLQPSSGISIGKIKECTANPSDVMNGKTFYSGDKSKKTGTMVNRGFEQTGGGFAWDNDYVYIQPIPEGYYYNDNPDNAPWNPRVKVEKQKMFDLLGGNNSGWSTTINPGGSVVIPRGYHDGEHRVYANNVQSQLKTASFNLSLSSGGVAYGETKDAWWSPGGTVIGMTRCQIRTDTESGNSSANWTRCTVENGQVHFVNSFTHRGGQAYAEGTVVYI